MRVQRGLSLAGLSIPLTLSHFVSRLLSLRRLGLWDLQRDGALRPASIKRQRSGTGMSQASAPSHLLSLAAGTEDGAALASFPHSFSPLPFHLPLPGPPTPSWFSDPEVRPFLVACLPSPSQSGASPRTPDEYSAFLIASPHPLFT